MARFTDLPPGFDCGQRHACPHLEGLPARWLWEDASANTNTG